MRQIQSKTTKILLVMQNEHEWLSSQDISHLLNRYDLGDVSPKSIAQLLKTQVSEGTVEVTGMAQLRGWHTTYDCGKRYKVTPCLYTSQDSAPVREET